jgi:ferritin-like metal-binding protein YciE
VQACAATFKIRRAAPGNAGAGTMQIANFRDMYFAELQELLSVEDQLAEVLPLIAEVVSQQELKSSLLQHHHETHGQKHRLQLILEKHGVDPKAHVDQSMQALINETRKMMEMLKGDALRDAGLIASVQRIQHYEIAGYGTACALAGQLDLRDDQRALHASLDEEKAADARLTELAKRKLNAEALAA